MSAQTDSIIAKATVAKALQDEAIALAQSISSYVPPGGGGGGSSPTPLSPVNLLGGTLPSGFDLSADTSNGGSPQSLLDRYTQRMTHAPDSRVPMLGHSQVQGFPGSLIPFAETFGCGGESSRRLWNRLRGYAGKRMLTHGGYGVLWTGVCDLDQSYYYPNGYSECAQTVGASIYPNKFAPAMTGRWIVVLPLPIHQSYAPAGYNAALQMMGQWIVNNSATGQFTSHTSAQIVFVDVWSQLVDASGNLKNEYHQNDGVHLTHPGNQIVADAINSAALSFSA